MHNKDFLMKTEQDMTKKTNLQEAPFYNAEPHTTDHQNQAVKQPKISILIPTRNRSNLLHQSLECLTHQDYQNLEVIIVDDCSDDNTPEVVERFKKLLPKRYADRSSFKWTVNTDCLLQAFLKD